MAIGMYDDENERSAADKRRQRQRYGGSNSKDTPQVPEEKIILQNTRHNNLNYDIGNQHALPQIGSSGKSNLANNQPRKKYGRTSYYRRTVSGGGQSAEQPNEAAEEAADSVGSDLLEQENSGEDNASTPNTEESDQGKEADAVPSDELEEKEEDKSLYNEGDNEPEKKKKNRFWTKKKATAAGGIAGILLGGGLTGLTLVSGPLEFLHLAHILHDSHWSHQESSGDSEVSKMYRYLRKGGSVGETRLGWLASKYYARTLADLASIGVVPQYGAGDIYKGFTVDTTHDKSPYKGMTPEEAAQAFEDNTGFKPSIEGGKLVVNADQFWNQKSAVKASIKELGLNGVSTAARARVMKKFGLVPGLFHPMKYIDQKIYAGAGKFLNYLKGLIQNGESPAGVDASKAQQTGTDQNGKPTTTDVPASVDTSSASKVSDTLKSLANSKGLKITGGIAAGVGLVCALKTVDDNIGLIRYVQVIQPLIRFSMVLITASYQIMSGQDVSLTDLSSLHQLLDQVDAHGNVIATWADASSIRAETGQSGGVDALAQNGVKDVLAQGQPSWLAWTQNSAVGDLCSGIGQAITGVVSVVVGIFSDGVASTALGWAASYLILPGVIDKVSHFLAGQSIDLNTLRGPATGEAGDYGSLLAANNAGIHSGAIQLSPTQSALLMQQTQQEQRNSFDSESFFARVFDVGDYRSLTGRLADSMLTSSVSSNIMRMFGTLTGGDSAVVKLPFNLFSDATYAAAPARYAYPFPTYDLTDADLNSKDVSQDRYANADEVAKILDASCLNGDGTTNTSCGYISKAESCFGDQITKDNPDHVWDVIPDHDINVYDPSYDAKGCAGAGDVTWHKIRVFIDDTGNMEGVDCARYDDAVSCANNGEGDDQTTTTASSGGTTIPTGTAQQLAQQLISSPNVSFQTPQEKTDFQQIVDTGHQTNCGDPAISPKLLGVLLNVTQKYKIVIGVVDDGHSCGSNPHAVGEAVDLNGVTPLDNSYPGTGRFIDWSAGEQPLMKQFDAYVGSVLAANGGGGLGQQQCFTTVLPPPMPSKVAFFPDSCDHQHVDVMVR